MADLQQLLDKTSRTFAISIPLLPQPTRTDVTVAYLLFRIADTLEDSENLPIRTRVQALEEFELLLDDSSSGDPSDFEAKWADHDLIDNRWYRTLIGKTGFLLDQLSQRDAPVQQIIRHRVRCTTQGMGSFLQSSAARLRSLADLQRYCYFVAGSVGEMLTEIFTHRIAMLSATDEVMREAKSFGEGLQLVNILKDSEVDADSGRYFIPAGSDRAELFRLARQDLSQAQQYVDRLRAVAAPPGYIAFAQLPLELAWETLTRVEQHGPGSKVPRKLVTQLLAEVSASTSFAAVQPLTSSVDRPAPPPHGKDADRLT